MPHRQTQGSCVCGAVHLTLDIAQPAFHACHCNTCRKWGGGPLLSVECRRMSISGEEQVRVYASSEWAERGFCGQCGSHLFYRLKTGELSAVPVGILDDDEELHFESQIFIDAKPGYYCFANQTRELTGEQVFAEFGPA